jgi:hypothetical protein
MPRYSLPRSRSVTAKSAKMVVKCLLRAGGRAQEIFPGRPIGANLLPNQGNITAPVWRYGPLIRK